MTLLHDAGIQRWLQGHLLCRVHGAGPRFSLTFDDGPSPRNTPRLLDTLARRGVRATFFMIARRIRRHRALARRILAEGHELGIHGDFHLPAWSLPRGWLARDLDYAMEAALEVTEHPPRHYRSPFGFMFPSQAVWVRSRGLEPVLGSIYPRDQAARKPEVIAHRVLYRLESGSIVILHDSSALGDFDRSPTIAAVDAILDGAAQRALQPVPIADLVDSARPATTPAPPTTGTTQRS